MGLSIDSYTACLHALIDSAGNCAIRCANASTYGPISSGSNARLIVPICSASSASKSRALKIISSARPKPVWRAIREAPPPQGKIPMPTSICINLNLPRAANRMSSANANSWPPPRANPSSLAIVACGTLLRRSHTDCKSSNCASSRDTASSDMSLSNSVS